MKKLGIVIAATTILFSSTVLANHSMFDMDDSACGAIAKACKAAGFDRKNEDKKFWMDCMEPLLLGKEVKGVTVDAEKVKECRTKKIDEMQAEVKKLQDVK